MEGKNSKYILFQKGLKVRNEEIENAIETQDNTENVRYVDIDDLGKLFKEKKLYYHEITYYEYHNEYIKLFFDIDCETILEEEDEIEKLEECIELITDFIISLMNTNIFEVNTKDINNIIEFIKENIRVTKSNSIEKTSFHIFFNYVYFNIECMKLLKAEIRNFISDNDNIFIKTIDLALYKKNTKLRTLHSKKDENNTDESYHKRYYNKSKNLQDYLFSCVNFNESYILFDIFKGIDIETIERNVNNLSNDHINIRYLTGSKLKNHVVNYLKKNKIYIEEDVYLKELDNDRLKLHQDMKFPFKFKDDMCFCGKKHKNFHNIELGEYYINIIKNGNQGSCKLLRISYPELSFYNIGEIMRYELEILKCSKDNKFISWDGKIWSIVDNEYKKDLLNLLMDRENLSIFKFQKDKDNIEKYLFGNNLDTIYTVARKEKVEINKDIYAFAFTNGIYDFKKDKFLTGNEAKKYISIYNCGYDYIPEETMTSEEKEKFDENYEYFLNVLEDILPTRLSNGELNQNRLNFDKIVAMSMLTRHKGLVIFLTGPTHSGKSTLKRIIKGLLGTNNCIEIGINNFTEENDTEKTPKPGIGSISYKKATFASESSYNTIYKAVQMKRLTELFIVARKMYSNENVQINHSIHFIDTNFEPIFDFLDPATSTRYIIIRVETHHFVNNNDYAEEESLENLYSLISRKIKIIDKDLEVKFNDSELNQAYFKYFKGIVSKFHIPNMEMPKFENNNKISDIQNAVVYSTFVCSPNVHDEFINLYSVEEETGRLYLPAQTFFKLLIKYNIIKSDDKVLELFDKNKDYFYVFKSHIIKMDPVTKIRNVFLKDKETKDKEKNRQKTTRRVRKG